MREVLRAVRLWLATAVKAAPALVVLQCALAILQAVTAPVQTYGVKLLVDGLTAQQSSTIGWGVGIIMAGFAVMFVGNVITGPVQDTTAERVFGRVFRDVLDTTTTIPGIAHHERPEISDKIELIREHSWRMGISFEMLLFVLGTLANTVTILGLLASAHPALLLLPVLGMARIWSAYLSVRWTQKSWEATAPAARLVDRLIEIIRDPRHAMELRVFGLRPVLVSRLEGLQDQRTRSEMGAVIRGARVDGLVRIGYGLVYAAAVVWLVWMARQGRASAGDVVLLILVAPQLDQMAGGIAGNVYWLGEILRSFMRFDWLRGYAEEHSWSSSVAPVPTRLHSGITLDGVGFAYPGSSDPVLSDVSLFLPAGSTVALVGENGAGKTTLVKLLCRLYDPTSGSVQVDDVDLRDIPAEAWRASMSAGFQDFVKWEFLARETVGIGAVGLAADEAVVRDALERADAHLVVDSLPDGLETQLGKRFKGGRDLSGGQWQRLALARTFMRSKPLLLLLDEPTAALDPEAEHALYDRFAQASREAAKETGGITVLVSHRFSTVRMADLIVVMADGRVQEVGTHADLVDGDGRYAELFEMQARAYR